MLHLKQRGLDRRTGSFVPGVASVGSAGSNSIASSGSCAGGFCCGASSDDCRICSLVGGFSSFSRGFCAWALGGCCVFSLLVSRLAAIFCVSARCDLSRRSRVVFLLFSFASAIFASASAEDGAAARGDTAVFLGGLQGACCSAGAAIACCLDTNKADTKAAATVSASLTASTIFLAASTLASAALFVALASASLLVVLTIRFLASVSCCLFTAINCCFICCWSVGACPSATRQALSEDGAGTSSAVGTTCAVICCVLAPVPMLISVFDAVTVVFAESDAGASSTSCASCDDKCGAVNKSAGCTLCTAASHSLFCA